MPIILVGRHHERFIRLQIHNHFILGTKSDLRGPNQCLNRDDILRYQKKIRALHYVECSAKTLQGIDDLMQKTIKIMVTSKERSCTIQ